MSNINSGYTMLDAGGLNLASSSSQTISGAWNRVQEAVGTGKPIIAYNMVYGTNKPTTPIPCFGWYISSTEFVLVSATLHVHVKNDNSCVVVDVTES